MIDTVIQCSKCEELISVIARSISFPFVCDGCTGGDTQMHELEKQEPYFDHAADAAEADEVGNDHEGATVEATTLLIEDLEYQLEQANADKKGLMEDIVFLGEQLKYSAGVNAFAAIRALTLTAELEESQAWEDLSHETIGKLLKERAELKNSLELTKALASNLEFQRYGLNMELKKAKRSPWRKFIDYMSANPYERVLDPPTNEVGNEA